MKDRHVDQLLSGAIYNVLKKVTRINEIPLLFLQFFNDLKGCKNMHECHTVQQMRSKKVTNRLVLATAIAKVVVHLLDVVLESRPGDIVALLVSTLETRIADHNTTADPDKLRRSREMSLKVSTHQALNGVENLLKQQEEESTRPIVFLVLGLSGSGKSTLVSVLRGSKNPKCRRSLGFRPVTMKYNDRIVTFYDVGGGEKIRSIWENYYHDAHGIIFVIDSTCSYKYFQKTIDVAKFTIGHKYIQGKPLLIINSKIDLDGSRSAVTIKDEMNITTKMEGQTKITEACLLPVNANFEGEVDPAIEGGIEWLINICLAQFIDLDERVICDRKTVSKIREEKEVR